MLRRYRPNSVLELGPGASSLLHLKYSCHLASFEESKEWLDHFKRVALDTRLLSANSKQMLETALQLTPRTEYLDELGELLSDYQLSDQMAAPHFDFIYVDGPTNWPQTDLSQQVPSSVRDPTGLLPNVTALQFASPKTIICVDGRRASVSFLLRKLSPDWLFVTGLDHGNILTRSPYHSIFVPASIGAKG